MRTGNGDEGGHDFRNPMQDAIKTVQAQAFAESLSKLFGTATGFAFTTFFLPFVIVYAYNGLQPAVWPDISYLPALAGLFVFRTLIHMVRKE